jgi:hypothetical protein
MPNLARNDAYPQRERTPFFASVLLITFSSAEIMTDNIIFSAESSAYFQQVDFHCAIYFEDFGDGKSRDCCTGQDGDARDDFKESGKEIRRSLSPLR